MVRGEVEQDATATRDPALPFGHRIGLSRLAERRLAGDDPTDRAVGNERARSREQRVVPAVEADRRDHSRALARRHELFAVGDPGRKWLLEVEMLAGLDRREGERSVLVGPCADDDRGDVLAIDRLLRVVGHVDVCDAPRALARLRRRIGDDDEAHATRSREHAKVHCARDRAAADERDPGLQGFTRRGVPELVHLVLRHPNFRVASEAEIPGAFADRPDHRAEQHQRQRQERHLAATVSPVHDPERATDPQEGDER